ncbi:hypothetical protein Baya_6088 [Bagarius yarrelli]|uniref:Uncharacterized protein n=1 Tax=Bagarius yarrelli TaxID=175774 RepID=A0A556U4Y5_BAGYA|nr:hypothetical protein Baya_6088 [Bagarius yarrelli]
MHVACADKMEYTVELRGAQGVMMRCSQDSDAGLALILLLIIHPHSLMLSASKAACSAIATGLNEAKRSVDWQWNPAGPHRNGCLTHPALLVRYRPAVCLWTPD